MKSTIAVVNSYPKFDAVFEPIAGEMHMAVKKYPGIKPMALELNAKVLPMAELALIIVTGTSEENDAALYQRNMGLIGQLAKNSRLESVPVLFLGLKGDNNLSSACADCGADYMDLPVRKRELMDKIKALTAAEKSPSPGLPSPSGRGAGGEGISKAESERRMATVMFADIAGFTAMSEKMDPEEVTGIMNRCFEMLGEQIEKNGGHIDKFIGDCVMVCFGVPRALENAPIAAVNTAIAMKKGLHQFNREKNLAIPLDIHIGINTGMVVSGTVGSAGRKDYTVMGDAVNLASRIEGASEKGQILVGPETYRATQNDFEYRTIPPVTLKGKAEPVPVYEVRSVKEAAARRSGPGAPARPRKKKGAATGPDRMIFSEMVGRDEEMNELRHALTGLVRGKGGIVSVIGEAGIGKSRLMAELKSDPAMAQVTLLEGQAISMGRTLSFHPIIDLLKNWAGISEEDNEGAQLAKLDRAVRAVHPAEADEIVPFVATMMGMKLSGKFADRVKGIEGEGLEKLIFKNVRALLIRGAELRPMIIRVEDLHWADTSSIELLSSLFRLAQSNRILFLNFFRPNYADTGDRVVKGCREEYSSDLTPAAGAPLSLKERGLEKGGSLPSSPRLPLGEGGQGGMRSGIYTEIVIQPLDGKESATLISNLLNIRGLPQSLRDQITDRAGGNPFFIEEVVRSLIDEGAVVRKGDSFAVTNKIHDVKVPLTINEVLMSRIDRLDEETRNLIKTASVIGRYFFYKIIAQVAQNISDIDSRLAHLEDIQLIRERKRLDELEYLFKHALAQEAAYESLLIQKRKELHLHVAQAIESVFGERLHEFYGMLAWHYSMGENLDRAEEYMLKAGEEAMKASASSEALGYFIKTMELYKSKYGDRADPAKIVELEKNIAMAYYNHGDFVEAVDFFTRVLEYNGEKIPKNCILKYLKFIWGFINTIVAFYLPVLKWRKPLNDKVIESINLFRKKLIALVHPDPHRFFIEFNCSINLILNYNILNDQYLLRMLPSFSSLFSWPSISYSISKAILSFSADRLKEPNEIGFAILNQCTATHEFMVGLWKINNFDETTVKCLVDNGEIFLADSYIIYIGFWSLETGNILSASRMVEKMSEIGETYDHLQTKGLKSILELRILMKTRRLRDALNEFDTSIAFFDRIGERILHFESHTFKARALLLSGDISSAGECLDYLEKLYHEMDLIPFYKSDYRIARFMFDMHQLEDALNSEDKNRIREYRKRAKQSGTHSLKISRKFKRDRTEALKLAGTRHWLLGTAAVDWLLFPGKFLSGLRALRHYRAAVRWWKKSIDMGTRLGAKLELSRTYVEIGKRLGGRFLRVEADPNGGIAHHHARLPRGIVRAHAFATKHIGITPEECLEKAEAMFREMGLEWDLAELEKVRLRL